MIDVGWLVKLLKHLSDSLVGWLAGSCYVENRVFGWHACMETEHAKSWATKAHAFEVIAFLPGAWNAGRYREDFELKGFPTSRCSGTSLLS